MARYIDSELIPYVESENGVLDDFAYRYDINETPTADVAPKSEVEYLEREIRLLTENSITVKYPHCVLGSYYAVLTKSLEDYDKVITDISSEAKAEVAMEIFEEIEKILNRNYYDHPFEYYASYLSTSIRALKKKYTEGERS